MLQIQESLNLCGFSIEVETVYIRKQLIWCTLFNRPSKKEAVLQTVSHYPVESDFELVSLVNKLWPCKWAFCKYVDFARVVESYHMKDLLLRGLPCLVPG